MSYFPFPEIERMKFVKKLISNGDCYYQQDKIQWADIVARLELDGGKSIIFSLRGDLDDFEIDSSEEFLNTMKHGKSIFWEEWINYEEYKDGILDGYTEYAHQSYLSERGFYKNGKKDGWWEFGDKYLDMEFDEDYYHALSDYRVPYVSFFSKGLS